MAPWNGSWSFVGMRCELERGKERRTGLFVEGFSLMGVHGMRKGGEEGVEGFGVAELDIGRLWWWLLIGEEVKVGKRQRNGMSVLNVTIDS